MLRAGGIAIVYKYDGRLSLFSQLRPSVLAWPRWIKIAVVLTNDGICCVLSSLIAVATLRPLGLIDLDESLAFLCFLSAVMALPVFFVMGVYRALFRFSGIRDIKVIFQASVVYFVVSVVVAVAFSNELIPQIYGMLQPIGLFFGVAASRFFAQAWLGTYEFLGRAADVHNVLIYGAGSAGRELASSIAGSGQMKIVGFLDDDETKQGQTLNGKRVFSPTAVIDLISDKKVTHIFLALPSILGTKRREILRRLCEHKLQVRTVPSVAEIAEGRVKVNELRELDDDDLLGRSVVEPNHDLLAAKIENKTVLITGAGGSVGSELCRQILALNPSRVLLVEANEFALYSIYEELSVTDSRSEGAGSPEILPFLCSIQDPNRIKEILSRWIPDVIYHAAAYKHVPLIEHNVIEGVKNNAIGTLVLAQAAIEFEIPELVLVSSDKAVRPTNVMGATKRLAEMILQGLQDSGSVTTRFSMVRFGNVLSSSGSVVPKFRSQIREGGPITVTHAEVTRFFMTIPEAAQLVIQSSALANGGEVFVLDMGEPIKIIDLARRMIRLSGLDEKTKENPKGDIAIKITGLRPGEKLHEELLIGDDDALTIHPQIRKAQEDFITWSQLKPQIDLLERAAKHGDSKTVIELLERLIEGFRKSDLPTISQAE